MSLKIARDAHGNVTLTNPETGKTEVVRTAIADRPTEVVLADSPAIPSHQWSAVPSHQWSVLPSHQWGSLE
jgi:hypothetical protein